MCITAYLASRRGSRDSQASNVSNEEIGPLNFSAHPRGRQRRTSNFLELPGTCFHLPLRECLCQNGYRCVQNAYAVCEEMLFALL